MINNMRPIHPGEILREELTELNLSARQMATFLHVPPNRVTAILNEQRAITADTALRLSRYFGTSPEFWMNLQAAYERGVHALSMAKKLTKKCSHMRPKLHKTEGAALHSRQGINTPCLYSYLSVAA